MSDVERELADEWVAWLYSDGWEGKPIYGADDDSIKFEKEGFVVHVYRHRPTHDGNKVWSCAIYGWGPDQLALELPLTYDWGDIKRAVTRCSLCGAMPVKTVRAGFANRVCEACLPEARRRLEYPGWTN